MVETHYQHRMEGDEYLMALVFNMGSQARLAESISDSDTRIPLTSYDTMLSKGGSGDSFYAQMINAAGDKEIVLVDVGNSNAAQGLSVTRGLESTAAQNWGGGTIIWQVLSEASVELIVQKALPRTVAFIPDGVLVSDYIGEKVYQTDLHLWWKAVAAASTAWRLIAGEVFVADVTFSPPPGAYTNGADLTMSCVTAGVSIYYTDDGSTPDETDTLYSGPFEMINSAVTTYKARAFGGNRWEQPSVNVASGEYTLTEISLWTFSDGGFYYDMTEHSGILYGSNGNSYLYGRADPTGSWSDVGMNGLGANIVNMVSHGSNLFSSFGGISIVYYYDTITPTWVSAGAPGGVGPQIITHGGNLYAVVSTGHLWRWDSGTTWSQMTTTPLGFTTQILVSDGTYILAGFNGPGGFYRWQVSGDWAVAPGTPIPASGNYRAVEAFSIDGDVYYMVQNNGYLYKHDGSDYSQVTTNQPLGAVDAADLVERSGHLFYASNDSADLTMYRWPGSGNQWIAASDDISGNFRYHLNFEEFDGYIISTVNNAGTYYWPLV